MHDRHTLGLARRTRFIATAPSQPEPPANHRVIVKWNNEKEIFSLERQGVAWHLLYVGRGDDIVMNQHTIARPIVIRGVGLHGGRAAEVRILPAAENAGIRFRRTDIPGHASFPAQAANVSGTQLCTALRGPCGSTVKTVEHLMSALWAAGIDNALIEVHGPEVPIMDGSAWPLLEQLLAAGIRQQRAPRAYLRILKPVVARGDDGSWAMLKPANEFSMRFSIDFEHPAIGHQEEDMKMDESVFRARIAHARTFGFLKQVEELRSNGLALGGSLENAVVLGPDGVLNADGLRYPTEFVRHKMLDAVGDLYLLGARVIGRFEGFHSSHALNVQLVHGVMSTRGAWRREAGRLRDAQAAGNAVWAQDPLAPAFV